MPLELSAVFDVIRSNVLPSSSTYYPQLCQYRQHMNRFITMGKSQTPRINGTKARVTPVLYTSLTGFDLLSGQPATTSIQSPEMEQFKVELVKPVAVPVMPDVVHVPVAVPDIVTQQPANEAAKSKARSFLSKARKR